MEIFGCIALALLGAFQLWVAFVGAAYFLGPVGAIAIFIASFAFRSTLPFMVFGLLGAWLVWGWWWPWAVLLMTPMLMFSLPSLLADAVAWWWRVLSAKH